MLPVDQIIPFIRHDDALVVDLAMHCLEWVRWPRRLTGEFVLHAVRDGHPQLARWLDDFTPTAAVLDFAIASLAERKPDCDDSLPFGAIVNAPDDLFTPEVIEAVGRLRLKYPWVAAQTWWRFETLAWPTERLRDRLLESCVIADTEQLAQSEQHEAAVLVARLAYRGDSVEWALAQLHARLGSNGWAEIWLFTLLVKSRHRPILDLAISRWRSTNPDDNEALSGELADAISELARPADLPAVAGLWGANEDSGDRSYLIEAVGRLRFPEAEGVLLDFARRADDPTLRTYAATGLCEMLCTGEESLQFVRGIVEREEFDTTQIELEEPAIALGIILRRPFPEAEGWRRRLADPGTRKERRSRFGSLFGLDAALMEQFDRMRERDGPDALPNAGGESSASYVLDRPARLAPAKTVGRNDPCPCGSGKKYKKCCLNK